ncbi:MAG: TIGR03943 family protein [Stanieria sp.]
MFNSFLSFPKNQSPKFLRWLDVLLLLAWGLLLLKYTVTGQYKLLIHPNYFGLIVVSSIVLLGLGLLKTFIYWQSSLDTTDNNEHITLLPTGWSGTLLLIVAIAGLLISPRVLNSDTALARGVSNTLPLTRSQPQAFRTSTKSEERSIIDWVRTLNAYPEPDAYAGQPANVTGFVIHLPELPDNYLLLSRFIVTCCAVDAYPVGIPVKLEGNRTAYPPDSWLTVTGTMVTENLASSDSKTTKRQLVLAAKTIKSIPTPADPYDY